MSTKEPVRWQIPRLCKRERLLAGVACGIADEIGIDPIIIRLSFVVLTAAGGWGAVLYGLCWTFFAFHESRLNAARTVSVPKGRNETERTVAVVLVVGGMLLLIKDSGFDFADAVVWPVVLLAARAVLPWRRTANGSVHDFKNRTWQVVVGGLLMLISVVLIVQLNLQVNLDLKVAFSTVVILGL
ncbi:MAG: PspC domain-containing protein [Acidimicrobiales bacterium]